MLGPKRSTCLLALVVLLGACGVAEEDAELQDGGAAPAEEAAVAPDLSGWDQDGDGVLVDAEWVAYLTDRLPWHVWDVDRSGALERAEFESGAVSAATDASFAGWDADGSGGVDGAEWSAAWLAIYDENEDGRLSAAELGRTL
jgi:hypothetical protein